MKHNPISTSFKLGIMAGGQLGKMVVQVANTIDIQTSVLDPSEGCPAANCCTNFVKGDFLSYDDVLAFGRTVDVITVELENINTKALKQLKAEGKIVLPDPEHIELIKDKGTQKQFYKDHNIPTSDFVLCNSADELRNAVSSGLITLPFVNKTRTEGYDGQGVQIIKTESDLDKLFEAQTVAEHKVDIDKEVAVIVARNQRGEVRTFPSVEMEFNPDANLVEFLFCPADISKELESECEQIALQIAEKLDFIGLLAVELFIDNSGKVLVNEVAPRPHNSGHHTIEACYTSQYEQHLRSILNMPLGSTKLKTPAVMVNLLGEPDYSGDVIYSGIEECLEKEGVSFHIYGKKQTRPFRKMGHVTIVDLNIDRAKEKARFVKDKLKVIA